MYVSSRQVALALVAYFLTLGLVPTWMARAAGLTGLIWGLIFLVLFCRVPAPIKGVVYALMYIKVWFLVGLDETNGFCWAELLSPHFKWLGKAFFGPFTDLALVARLPARFRVDPVGFCVYRVTQGLYHVDKCGLPFAQVWPAEDVLAGLLAVPDGSFLAGALVPFTVILAMLLLFVAIPLATFDLWDRQILSTMMARHRAAGLPTVVAWFFTAVGWSWYLISASQASYVIGPLIFMVSLPLFFVLFFLSVLQFLFDTIRFRLLPPAAVLKRAARNKARALRRASLFDFGGRKARKELERLAKEQDQIAEEAALQALDGVEFTPDELEVMRLDEEATSLRKREGLGLFSSKLAQRRGLRTSSPSQLGPVEAELDTLPGPEPSLFGGPALSEAPPSYVSRVRQWVGGSSSSQILDEVVTPRIRPLVLPSIVEGRESPAAKPMNLAGSSG